METYPIMIDEAPAGKLTVDRRGARCAFDAECRMLPGLIRISVYGGGKEGYLGVLAPENGALRLHKTLTRIQMRNFPQQIDSVERSGLDRTPETDSQTETPTPPRTPIGLYTPPESRTESVRDPPEEAEPAAQQDTETVEQKDIEPAEQREEMPLSTEHTAAGTEPAQRLPEPEPDAPAKTDSAAPPESADEAEQALSWYASPDGALVCFDGARSLIALPLGDPRIPPDLSGEERTVEGKRYLVYRTRDGKIVR